MVGPGERGAFSQPFCGAVPRAAQLHAFRAASCFLFFTSRGFCCSLNESRKGEPGSRTGGISRRSWDGRGHKADRAEQLRPPPAAPPATPEPQPLPEATDGRMSSRAPGHEQNPSALAAREQSAALPRRPRVGRAAARAAPPAPRRAAGPATAATSPLLRPPPGAGTRRGPALHLRLFNREAISRVSCRERRSFLRSPRDRAPNAALSRINRTGPREKPARSRSRRVPELRASSRSAPALTGLHLKPSPRGGALGAAGLSIRASPTRRAPRAPGRFTRAARCPPSPPRCTH